MGLCAYDLNVCVTTRLNNIIINAGIVLKNNNNIRASETFVLKIPIIVINKLIWIIFYRIT